MYRFFFLVAVWTTLSFDQLLAVTCETVRDHFRLRLGVEVTNIELPANERSRIYALFEAIGKGAELQSQVDKILQSSLDNVDPIQVFQNRELQAGIINWNSEVIAAAKALYKDLGVSFQEFSLEIGKYRFNALRFKPSKEARTGVERIAQYAKVLSNTEVIYSPATLLINQAFGMADGKRLFISHQAINTTRMDLYSLHELVHSYTYHLGKINRDSVFGGALFPLDHKGNWTNREIPLPSRFSYPDPMQFDEILAHAVEGQSLYTLLKRIARQSLDHRDTHTIRSLIDDLAYEGNAVMQTMAMGGAEFV